MYNPTVIDNNGKSERAYDIYSRLLKDRIIFIGTAIDENVANSIIAQLLYLEAEDPEKDIIMYINSPGGSVFSAVAIANTLKNHKAKVTANIDGLAASAATIITSACDTVRMPKNALFMIHNPITFAYGNNQEMQKTVEMLDKVKNSIIETYLSKTKTDKETLSELMDNETWMDAETAKEYGFVDEIVNEEVGKEFGVTRERVRQIEAKTLEKLRTHPSADKIRLFAE